jgi:hypothetical protein
MGVGPLAGQVRMDVRVKKSDIEGLGIFAVAPCRSGQRIRRVNVLREITLAAPLREDLGERADHCDYPNGRVMLIGPPDCYVNHSCDPNAYVEVPPAQWTPEN